jgi:ribosomal protein S7
MNKIINTESAIARTINVLTKKGNKIQALKIMKNVCKTIKPLTFEKTLLKGTPEYKTKTLKNKVEIVEGLNNKQRQQIRLKGLSNTIRKSRGKKPYKVENKLKKELI